MAWKKQGSENNLFDVTMGGHHGAEICELVGLFILDGLHAIFNPKWVGLYRDDGLAVVRRSAGRHIENMCKKYTIL